MKQKTFVIPGEPQGKARPRFTKGHTYTPRDTVEYERLARLCYQGQSFGNVPVGVDILAVFGIPKSTSKRQRERMLCGAVLPTKKPDADNITKIICDALNGVAYDDDKQIAEVRIRKVYGPVPQVQVTLWALEDHPDG